MRNIFVCAPYAPNSKDLRADICQVAENIEKMEQACKLITLFGDMPLAPHLYFDNWVDSCEAWNEFAAEWIKKADLVYVIGTRITPDMMVFLEKAKEFHIPVMCVADPEKFYEQLGEAVSSIPCDCDRCEGGCCNGE